MIINFVVLFTLFYLLGSVIDIIVNLDEFDKIASKISKDGNFFVRVYALIRVAIGFEGPRLFQVFAYLHGVIAVGSMAFTAANMLKSREFVAIMAAGVSLRRLTIPFLIVMGSISVVAFLNQEYMLPKVAPLLLRDHSESNNKNAGSFMVPFTPDKSGALLLAPSLNPSTGILTEPSFLERDKKGRMIKQIQAESASWDSNSNLGWNLVGGRSVDIVFDDETDQATIMAPVEVSFYETELSPYILTLHRYGQYIGMLGMSQLNNMLDAVGVFDAPMLRRHWYSRFASIAMNIIAMLIVIPLFVTREQVVLSVQAVKCGGVGLAILFGGTIAMFLPYSGIPAVVSVFLPTLILFPIALLRVVNIRT
jgi:lipopolysaccharide export LptBFGC system permease protein LptF